MTTQEYQNLVQMMTQLATQVAALGNTVNNLVTVSQQQVNAQAGTVTLEANIEKPAKFKGDGSIAQNASGARAFIAAFTNFAANNVKLSPGGTPKQSAWIQSFLSFMDGPAREWAVPYLEAIADKKDPWASWDECKKAFSTCFSVIASDETARDRINKLQQGNRSLPDFAAKFAAVGALTGYNNADLMRHFRKGLKPSFSEKLAIRGGKYTKLSELIDVASQLYNDLYEEDRRHKNSTGSGSQSADYGEAMDIDALRQGSKKNRFDFIKWMKGRCFGCGSQDHNKSDCTRIRSGAACGYCGRIGHFQDVCQDKYLGLDRGRGLRSNPGRSGNDSDRNIHGASQEEDKAEQLAAKLDKIQLQLKELNAAKAEVEEGLKDFL
ncbi:unnamed protein product [Peniophora sp. CBMAI 1063]|nr:unnamed protein product [Peniophora sp. CBMAI 1063]